MGKLKRVGSYSVEGGLRRRKAGGAVGVIQGFWFSELTGEAKWMSEKGGAISPTTVLRK